jgi:ABC-type Fe3+-hydroxamate transport system substrate-binding protein
LWKEFGDRIEALKQQTVDFIKQEKAKGKIICGYGASTKGNTLLQYFGLDNTLIDAIAERSPYKYGLKTIGTNIPILSEEDVRNMNPDYMLVLPWHFIKEFVKREDEFLSKGGKFIVPCPEFEIIGK